ncbi:MAG: hypothetical protein ABSC19_09700 [Syntrophorhabdales bacterium]
MVKLFGTLGSYAPGYNDKKGVIAVLDQGKSIGDLLNVLGLPEKEARVFFVKGISRELTHELHDLDEVNIFLPLAGR